MSISSSINELKTIKVDLANAIKSKGISVGANEGFSTYSQKVLEIAPDPTTSTPDKFINGTRPTEWPDYSKISLAGQEVCYLTYDYINKINDVPRHLSLSVNCTGNYTISRGTISDNGFTPIENFTAASGATTTLTELQTGSDNYVCYKITGTTITSITLQNINLPESATLVSAAQNVVEIYSRLPNLTSISGLKSKYTVYGTYLDCAAMTSLANAWSGCTSLQSLNLSGWNTSAITNLSSAWSGCSSLKNLDIGNWNISNVTNLSSAWSNCTSLKSLNLLNWNTAKVTNLSNTWSGCSALITLEIKNWKVTKVTTMDSAWSNCYALKKLELSNWSTNALNFLSNAWNGCTTLEYLDLSGFILSNIPSISNIFISCSNLRRIIAPTTGPALTHSLNVSTLYSASTLVAWIGALPNLHGYTSQTLALGTTNKNKLTSQQIAVATNKNWSVT